MNLKIPVLALLFLCLSVPGRTQMKTMELEEVVIEGLPFEKFSSGSKIVKSDSLTMAQLGQETLAQYVLRNTTGYIKEQGHKMLASVSFRGTGSSHTGVFWHGVNINSLTLGSTNFSGVPLFLFDDIAVHYGGASSLHGSDAIGGSIHLNSTPTWEDGAHAQFRYDYGSFGNHFSGVKVNFGNGKWEAKTRAFNHMLKNNFKYSVTDRLGNNSEIEQEHAEVHNYGVLQEVNGKISKRGFLSLKGWFGKNRYEIQPMMVTYPGQPQDGDEIFDRNLRLVAEYQHFYRRGALSSSLGYVRDYQLFDESDVIETKRGIASLSYEWNMDEKTILKAGGASKYIVPNVWAYQEDLTEWRSDVFISVKRMILENWSASLNARKTFVPFTVAPVAPSLSTGYRIKKGRSVLAFRAQLERSYRVPTFNDRYWGEQGRPDLKSEHGFSVELGHNFVHQGESDRFEFDISGYYMKQDDWIAWKPTDNLWRPFNLKKVEAAGVEVQGKYGQKIRAVQFEVGGLYALNRSVLLEGVSENDAAVGYQLPYTPKHRAVLYASLMYKKFRLSINNQYTGTRYGIDVIHEKIEGFFLTDLRFGKDFSLGEHHFSLEGQVLNVFDVAYQNVKRYAMPGRNYLMSINFYLSN
ncbi:MAG: TonB-dependent receptor [Cytophagales bacterium]|nr:TonB-dependent receptor [Cytophagales bacterium]